VAQEIVVSYRAEVDKLTGELNKIIAQQEEIALLEKKGNLEVQKGVTAEQQAAKKRTELLKLEEAELLKLQKLRKLAFDPKTIKAYDDAITKSQRNIQLLGGKTRSTLNEVSNQVKSIGAGIATGIAAAFTITAITSFGKASINAFLEAQETAERLRFTITQINNESEQAFNRLIEQSAKLQKATIFSDDALQQAQNVLATFGLTADEIEAFLPKLADFASQTKQDIVSAANAVGGGLQGMGREFKKFGIEVSANNTELQNYNEIVRGFIQFQGAAAEETKTLTGQLKQQENQVDDLQEEIGEGLAPAWVVVRKAIFSATLEVINFFKNGGQPAVTRFQQSLEGLPTALDEVTKKVQEQTAALIATGSAQEEAARNALNDIRAEILQRLQLRIEQQRSIVANSEASETEQRLARLRLAGVRNELVAIEQLIDANRRRVESNAKTLTQEQLKTATLERLNILLEANGKLNTLVGKNNVTLIERELEARKKLAEQNQKDADIAKKLKDAIDEDFQADRISQTTVQIDVKFDKDQIIEAVNDANIDEILEDRPVTVNVKINSGNLVDSIFKLNDDVIDASLQLANSLSQISSQLADRRIADLERTQEKEFELLDLREEAIDDQLEKRRISEKEAERQKDLLDKKRIESEKKLADQVRAIKRRQAILDKTAAIIEITINTARAVSEALASGPPPGNIALAAISGALGAAQTAIVAATPIPYKKGSKDTGAKGHMARVGEEGEEIVFMPAKSKVLPAKQTRTYGDVLDAMYDNRFEKYILKSYVAPALEQQRKRFDQHKQESFAQNLGKSIVYNTSEVNNQNGIGSTPTAEDIARSVSRRQLQVNAEEIGRAVARNLPTNPYNR